MDNTIHFVLQGKGGIGKSFIAVMLAQYLKTHTEGVRCFDTDQENTTFGHYRTLGVEHVPVMNASRTIDAKRFDALMEKLIAEDATFVIDNGANTFSPLLAYLIENQAIGFLNDNGKKVYVHTVVGGGDALADTANGFHSLAEGIDNAPILLWLNEHFGEMRTAQGMDFRQTPAFLQHTDRLLGLVSLPARNHQTYGEDVRKMNTKRMTVEEVLASPEFFLMEKQRIKNVANDIFAQLDAVPF